MKILGEGSFSTVYEKGSDRVLKVEDKNYVGLLRREARMMIKMSEMDRDGKFVIPVYGYIEGNENGSMEMKRMKISLGEIMKRLDKGMDDYSIKNLMRRLIINLNFIHKFGVCHGDIKPDNVMLSEDYRKVYFVDFGLYKNFRVGKNHVKYKDKISPSGTLRYMSKNVNGWIRMTRRDDMISLGYMMVYLQKLTLPWLNIGLIGKKDKYEKVYKMKECVDLGELCDGCVRGMEEYMRYCYGLDFEEEPDYDYLLGLFN